MRREQRRPSNEIPEQEPADYDVLVHDIVSAKLEYWNWKNTEWQDTWDTTQADGQKGWLPSRVRITVVVKDSEDSGPDQSRRVGAVDPRHDGRAAGADDDMRGPDRRSLPVERDNPPATVGMRRSANCAGDQPPMTRTHWPWGVRAACSLTIWSAVASESTPSQRSSSA